jgi:hypothetical protein
VAAAAEANKHKSNNTERCISSISQAGVQ